MAATSGAGVPVILHSLPAGTSHAGIGGHPLKCNASKGCWGVKRHKLSASQEECAVRHFLLIRSARPCSVASREVQAQGLQRY